MSISNKRLEYENGIICDNDGCADVSAAEDAYEEGRSLAEEDRRNGTSSHEGDDYNDCDDDYDEGYDE